jgi:hypothetical protein
MDQGRIFDFAWREADVGDRRQRVYSVEKLTGFEGFL